jgi:hypothetical protein
VMTRVDLLLSSKRKILLRLKLNSKKRYSVWSSVMFWWFNTHHWWHWASHFISIAKFYWMKL